MKLRCPFRSLVIAPAVGVSRWLCAVSVAAALAVTAPMAVAAEENLAETQPESAEMGAGAPQRNVLPSLEDMLSEAAPSDVPRERCLTRRDIKTVRVLDDGHLLFRTRSGKYWLNRLDQSCVGLHHDMLMVLDEAGMRVCNSDRVYGRERSSIMYVGVTVDSATCFLGDFQPMDAQQAKAIYADMLRRNRR